MELMREIYTGHGIADVLDKQWIGREWDVVFPGLVRVDAVSDAHDGFDADIRELVDETVKELEALYAVGLESSEGGGISNEDFEPESAPISDLPAWEPMLLEQLSPQAEVISGIAEEDAESGEESMTDAETMTADIPFGTASDSLWLWPQTTGPIMAFSGAPMLARSARVLVIR
ncbi:MAG: hypothetical protein HY541_07220 [Deltaproteobacteria bacterium]|nr:hypothetical protein [Deltaproteobacteria bacterium]